MEYFIDELCFLTTIMAVVSAVMVVFRIIWFRKRKLNREKERIAVSYSIFLSVFLGILFITLAAPLLHLTGYVFCNLGYMGKLGISMYMPYPINGFLKCLILGILLFCWSSGFIISLRRDRKESLKNGYARMEGYNEIICQGRLYSLYEETAQDMEIKNLPFLMVNPTVTSPETAYSLELRSMCVLLPPMRTGERELKIMLAHELAHVKRKDVQVRYLFRLLGEIYWFLGIWKDMKNELLDLQETLCDKMAIDQFDDLNATDYYSFVVDTTVYLNRRGAFGETLESSAPLTDPSEKEVKAFASFHRKAKRWISFFKRNGGKILSFLSGLFCRKSEDSTRLERRILNMIKDANSRSSSGSITLPMAFAGMLVLSLVFGIWCYPGNQITEKMISSYQNSQVVSYTERFFNLIDKSFLLFTAEEDSSYVEWKNGRSLETSLDGYGRLSSPVFQGSAGEILVIQACSDDGDFCILLEHEGMTEWQTIEMGTIGVLEIRMENTYYQINIENTQNAEIGITAYYLH